MQSALTAIAAAALILLTALYSGLLVADGAARRTAAAEPATFEIATTDTGPVQLEVVFADGRERELDDPQVERRGFEPAHRVFLSLRAEGTAPAVWRCRCATLLVGFRRQPGGGDVVVRRGGHEIWRGSTDLGSAGEFDLERVARPGSLLWFEYGSTEHGLPPAHAVDSTNGSGSGAKPGRWQRSRPWWIAWWVAIAVAAVWTRLWRGDDRAGRRGTVLAVAIAHLAWWLTQPISIMHDSPYYFRDFDSYARYFAQTYFPIGYGLLGEPASWLPIGWRGNTLTLLQAIATTALAGPLFEFVRRIGTPGWLTVPAVFLALAAPSQLLITHGLYSEVPTTLGLLAACVFATRARFETGSRPWLDAALAGAAVAIAGLARGLPLPIGLGVLAVIFWPWSGGRARTVADETRASPTHRHWARGALAVTSAVALFALPLLPVKYYNGKFALTMAAGEHMFNSVVQRRGYLPAAGPATEEFRTRLGDAIDGVLDLHHLDRRQLLEASGLTDKQAMILQGRVAGEALREAPVEFARLTAGQAMSQLPTHPDQPWRRMTDTSVADWNDAPPLHVGAATLLAHDAAMRVERAAWPVAAWASVGLLLVAMVCYRRREVYALALCAGGMLFGTAAVELSLPRYTLTVMPFCWIALVAAPAWLVAAVAGRRRQPGRTPTA